jgi:hypothetical protein
MTDAELDTILDLYNCDDRLFWGRFAGLSPEDRRLVMERRRQRGRQADQRNIAATPATWIAPPAAIGKPAKKAADKKSAKK